MKLKSTILLSLFISGNCALFNLDCDNSSKFPYKLINQHNGCDLIEEEQDELDKLLVSLSVYQNELAVIRQAARAWQLGIEIKPIAIPKAHHWPRIYISEKGCETGAWIKLIPGYECMLFIEGNAVFGITKTNINTNISTNKGMTLLNYAELKKLAKEPFTHLNLLKVTTVHEIGHLIGFEHSNKPKDTMYAYSYSGRPSSAELLKAKEYFLYRDFPNVIYVVM